MSRIRKTTCPSNLPGTGKGHGRKAKPGPCAKCGVEGPLLKGFCRRCYLHQRYLARPGVIERRVELKAKRIIKEKKEQLRQENKTNRTIKEKEKQLRSEKWRATHPGRKHLSKAKKDDRPGEGSPAWVSDWLREQVKNFLHTHSGRFDKNLYRTSPEQRYVMLTEDQVMELCRIIYMAVSKHSSTWHKGATDKHQRKAWWDRAEGDGSYLDRAIAPELRGLAR